MQCNAGYRADYDNVRAKLAALNDFGVVGVGRPQCDNDGRALLAAAFVAWAIGKDLASAFELARRPLRAPC
jgi:hypothetical protein